MSGFRAPSCQLSCSLWVLPHLFSELLRESWERVGSQRGGKATGPGVRKPGPGLACPLAHSVTLAVPYLGLSFLTCQGSRLVFLRKHQEKFPQGQAGDTGVQGA